MEFTMNGTIRQIDQCRVCGRNDWLDVISFGPTPLANGLLDPALADTAEPSYPVDVVVCRECRLMSLRHVVDPGVLFTHYVYVSSDSDQISTHMRRVADWCRDNAGLRAGDLVVELGSNVGTQLALFQRRGMRVVGVDPARNLAEIANSRGVETIADFFGPPVTAPLARDRGPATIVIGRQCFAHIDDVHNVLDGVDAVLAPDGMLVIEVPYLLDLLDRNQFDTIYHEHLSYYSLTTLGRLFASHGLNVTGVERAEVHGGSIIAFASRASAGRTPSPRVAELLALEERRGLGAERPYREFAARTAEVTAAVGGLVRDLAAKGARIVGYGAPSKGSALLQACGLGAAEIEFCVDTTPFKQGKRLPATHIPVWAPERARTLRPDFYLLLAWNYADEIIGKERDFLERGGRFIVPIPWPRLVSADGEIDVAPRGVAAV
jgi:C-methyltransferase